MLRTVRALSGHASWQHGANRWFSALVVCLILGTGSPALAQDSTPEPDVIDVPVATEAPLPTAIPPTEVPPPTVAPATDVPASEEPVVTEIPSEPPEVDSLPPTEPVLPDEPTVEPSATPTPNAVIAYSLAAQPACVRDPDGPSTISSGGSLDYRCTDTVTISGTHVVAADIDVTWIARAVVAGGWSVQLLPPTNAAGEADWTAAGQGEAWFSFDQQTPLGTAADVVDLDQTIEITYRLRVHRAACGLQVEIVRLSHDVTLHSRTAGADIASTLASPREPLRLTPDLRAIPEPILVFHDAPTFGAFEANSSGLVDSTSTGTMILIVTGLDTACGNWQVRLSATEVAGADGSVLDGARLVVTSIDGEPLAAGGCDLITPCTIADLTGGGADLPNLTLTIGVSLVMPDFVPPGRFHMSFDADLQSMGSADGRIAP